MNECKTQICQLLLDALMPVCQETEAECEHSAFELKDDEEADDE